MLYRHAGSDAAALRQQNRAQHLLTQLKYQPRAAVVEADQFVQPGRRQAANPGDAVADAGYATALGQTQTKAVRRTRLSHG